MSSQKGNAKRTRPQKYQNSSAFRNNLHDKTKTIQMINNLVVSGVCARCKDVIDWKIKYKKYKHLTQPKTCVKCHQKVVKMAYYIMCQPCASQLGCCAKCSDQTGVVLQAPPTVAEASSQQAEFQKQLKGLSEKKRRKFLRLMGEGKLKAEDLASEKQMSELDAGESELPCSNQSDYENDQAFSDTSSKGQLEHLVANEPASAENVNVENDTASGGESGNVQ